MGSCTSCTNNVSRRDTLHIISVVFNPSGYNSRVKLYNEYRERLERVSGVKLYTIECLFDDQEPTVANRKQDMVVRAPHKLWLKENLINIAVRNLPSDWKYMAWVDGDIEFHGRDWVSKTIHELEKRPIVQMWKEAHFLGPDNRSLEKCTSFGYYVQNEVSIDITKFHKEYPHPGFAWAMTRRAFESIGGLPEFCVVGSGDNHFAYALIGRVMESIPPQSMKHVSSDYEKRLVSFEQHLRQSVYGLADHSQPLPKNKGPGFVDVTISHHWHGDWKDRNYVSRWECLEAFPGTESRMLFKPSVDLAHDSTGVLYLKTRAFLKPIEKYFDSRKEDGMVVNTDHKNKHGTPPTPPAVKALPQYRPTKAKRGGGGGGGHNGHHRNGTTTNHRRNHNEVTFDHYDEPDHYNCDTNQNYHCHTTDYHYGGGGGGGGCGGGDVFSASNHAYC